MRSPQLPYFKGNRLRVQSAFTLVELLVSMAVLTLLLVIVVQLVNSASAVTKSNQMRLDTDNQAREIFDRMGRDFNAMIRRPDVDCSIYPYSHYPVRPCFKNPEPQGTFSTSPATTGANDFLYFYTQTAAITAATGASGAVGASRQTTVADSVAVVGYRIWGAVDASATTPYYALERLCVSTASNVGADRPMLFLVSGSGNSSYVTAPKNADALSTIVGGELILSHADIGPSGSAIIASSAHAFGDQVFRLEFALQMSPDYIAKNIRANTYSASDPPYWKSIAYNATPPTAGVADPRQIQDMHDVVAIIVTMALLDNTSRSRIPGYDRLQPQGSYSTDMSELVMALKDGDTPAVASDWANAIVQIGASKETPARNISAIARRQIMQNVRIYQRSFILK